MWEEEKFALKLEPNHSHYLLWLGLGLCTWGLQKPAGESSRENHTTVVLKCLIAVLASMVLTLLNASDISVFVVSTGLLLCLIGSLLSVSEAVGFMLILYVCRPWEVLPKNDFWLQVPRTCIWLWLFAWMKENGKEPLRLIEHVRLSSGVGWTLVLGLWSLLTTLVSRDPSGSQQFYFDTFFRALTLVVILHLSVRTEADVKRLQKAFIVGISTLALFSLWAFKGLNHTAPIELLPQLADTGQRRLEAVGSLGNSNDIAAVILIPLGFLWPVIFARKTSLFNRTSASVLAILLLKSLLASQSRGAFLASAAQIGLLFVSRAKNPKKVSLLLVLVMLCAGLCANQIMGRNADDLDASTESRMNYYVTGLSMALKSPVWGQGFGRYPYEFERFTTMIVHEWGLRTAHSSWVLVLAETGCIGLLLFSIIHLKIFQAAWTLRTRQPALLLSLSGYSITILFLSHTWLMFPWILFTLIDLHLKVLNSEQSLAAKQQDTVQGALESRHTFQH